MEFRVTDNVTEQDIEEIHRELKKFNLAHREPSQDVPIGIFYEDENGVKMGGLTGETFGNWLCVKYLWVSEELRGQGIGSQLLHKAEEEALLRGAQYCFLDTFSFQAPEFYRKHGYQEVFHLFEYPYTGKRFYFIKELTKQ